MTTTTALCIIPSAPENGRALYHSIWQTVKDRYYDPSRIANWDQWEHRFDTAIDGVESAQKFAREMVAQLHDKYSLVSNRQQVEEQETEASVESGGAASTILPHNIGYIRIGTFCQYNIFDQVRKEMEKVKDCDAFIIDLRNNSGGFLNPTARCLELFIEKGPITTIESKLRDGVQRNDIYFFEDTFFRLVTHPDGREESIPAHRATCLTGGKPMVLLLNRGSASSSELFAAAILDTGKDDGSVIAVGEKSFGKGIVQDTIEYPTCSVTLTSGRYLGPNDEWFGDGAQTVANGIVPDIRVRNDKNNEALKVGFEHLARKLGRFVEPPKAKVQPTLAPLAFTAAAALIGVGLFALGARRRA